MKKSIVWFASVVGFVLLIAGAYTAYDALRDGAGGGGLVTTAAPQTGVTGESVAGSDTQSGSAGTGTAVPPPADFTVLDKDRNPVRLSDMAGRPAVINFWASWCYYCKQEMPEFEEVYLRYAGSGEVAFMMINATDGVREKISDGEQYIKDSGFTFPVYYDTLEEAVKLYGISAFPTTLFIDRNGYVAAYAKGAIDAETLEKGIAMIK